MNKLEWHLWDEEPPTKLRIPEIIITKFTFIAPGFFNEESNSYTISAGRFPNVGRTYWRPATEEDKVWIQQLYFTQRELLHGATLNLGETVDNTGTKEYKAHIQKAEQKN